MIGKIIFHGGCVTCQSQEIFGKARCVGCQYFEADWRLPNLNTQDNIREREMKVIRDNFRKLAKESE